MDNRVSREPDPLRLYAIIRSDLAMSSGKLAAQAGHAFVDTFFKCLQDNPDMALEYKNNYHGIKVVLSIDSLAGLKDIEQQVKEAGIYHALVTDLGYTQFKGISTVTVLGIGPVRKSQVNHILGHLKLCR